MYLRLLAEDMNVTVYTVQLHKVIMGKELKCAELSVQSGYKVMRAIVKQHLHSNSREVSPTVAIIRYNYFRTGQEDGIW